MGRLRLIAEKNRLIEEERKRCEQKKREQDDMISQIKSIFKEAPSYPNIEHINQPPLASIFPRYAIHMPRKRCINTDQNHVQAEIVTLSDSEEENSDLICDTENKGSVESLSTEKSNSDGVEKEHISDLTIAVDCERGEPEESILKIESVYSEASGSKLSNPSQDIIFDSSSGNSEIEDDSDIEIIEPPFINKKPKILKDSFSELLNDDK